MNKKLMDYLWSIAPPEANYIAMDSDYTLNWFERVPAQGYYSWSRVNGKTGTLQDYNVDWEETLTRRPTDV